MVITTDFNIFADKYHNKQHLPDDMISMIMNINTEEIKTEIKDTHKMWNKQVLSQIINYSDRTKASILENEDEYSDFEESYGGFGKIMLGIIEYDYEMSTWSDDEEDGSG